MKVEMVKLYKECGEQYKILKKSVFTAFEFTGLGRGGQQIQRAKEVYTKAVETLVELASLQVKKKKSILHMT